MLEDHIQHHQRQSLHLLEDLEVANLDQDKLAKASSLQVLKLQKYIFC
jgi:hypothetical protein